MLRVFQTKTFARFARAERIEATALFEAVERAKAGLVDADLSGGLIKQRVARKGQGRSGGYRVLIALCADEFSYLLYGFAKKDRDNLDDAELCVIRELADTWLAANYTTVAQALLEGRLVEVGYVQNERSGKSTLPRGNV